MSTLIQGSIPSVLANGNRYPNNSPVELYFDAEINQLLIPVYATEGEETVDDLIVFKGAVNSALDYNFKMILNQESTNAPTATFFEVPNEAPFSLAFAYDEPGKYELEIIPDTEGEEFEIFVNGFLVNNEAGGIGIISLGDPNIYRIFTKTLQDTGGGVYAFDFANGVLSNSNFNITIRKVTA